MEKLFKSLILLGFTASLPLAAQTNKTKVKAQPEQQVETVLPDAKTNFVTNQNYLSPSSLKDYKSFYGDSLKGFDEAAIRPALLQNNVVGQEYLNYMKFLKRDFVNQKYKIGTYAPKPLVPSGLPVIGAKPTGGGSNMINSAPCVNEDFESTTPGQYSTANGINGWTVQSGFNNTTIYTSIGNSTYGAACNANALPSANWANGSPECWIVTTPILNVPSIGTLPNSPLGGTQVIKLQDVNPNGLMTRISSTFPVTNANTLFQFAYAGSWDGVHDCCGQPAFRIDMYDCANVLLSCSNVSLTPSGSQCSSGVPGYSVTGTVSWTNWVVKYIDLTPYIGTCVTIVVTNADCSYSGHHGSAYFDARCGGQLIGSGLGGVGGNIPGPVSFCAGSNQAQISAPLGYATYSWVAPAGSPTISAAQATLPTLPINGPVAGAVYTVFLTASSGCQFIATNTIQTSTVNIAGVGAFSTCAGGASGSATVQGNGSGSGYNYTWLNSSSVTVGTQSIVNNLAAGVYSVIISGLGAAGCGSAMTTVTVNTAPPGITNLLKPYCNGQAYLNTNGGSNFQWYNGNSAISPTAGGIASGYTVTSPSNGAIYWLSYTSAQGCQDSVKYTLVASPPGIMNISYNKLICPNGTDGVAVVSMTPAPGSPPGTSSYSVFNTGSLTPSYNASLYPTSANSFTVTNLVAGGTYSVKTFDGSCLYSTNFTVPQLVWNYTVSPVSPTLCPGQSIPATLTFTNPPSLGQYSYSWTPNVFLAGNNNTSQNTIISPTAAIGTQTTINYVIVVTPTIANCPITKTLSITSVNPPIPSITAIPALCNNSALYTINATPSGGTFNSGITGTNNPIGTTNGVINPLLAFQSGTNSIKSFTYAISVNTCVATKVFTYQVSQFNPATITSTIAPICVGGQPFNLMNIVQYTGGTWSSPNPAPNPYSQLPNGGIVGNGLNQALNTNPLNNANAPVTGTYQLIYSTQSSPNPAACPNSSTVGVVITRNTTPTISPVSPFCTSAPSFSMAVTPAGGGWSGSGIISNAGVVTPTLQSQAGNVSVTYTVYDGPCLNSASTILNISKFNTAALTGTVPHLCATSAPFNLMGIVQSTVGGAWSSTVYTLNANGIPALNNPSVGVNANNLFNPSGTLPTGLYQLTYNTSSSPNATLCPDTRTIVASLLNPQMPNITQVGPYCSKHASMQLSVTPNTGSWTGTSYLSTSGVFSPSVAAIGSNAVQYVVGTSTCNVQQTKYINVEAFVPATIMNSVPDQCNTGSATNLLPFTQSNLGVWSGPGISGTSFNPGVAGAGSFILHHNTASSPSGLCPDHATVAVNVYSLASPVVTPVGPMCNSSAPVKLKVSPVGGLFGGANTKAVSLNGLFNPASGVIGNNIINYSITSGPCVAYAQATINIEKFISADFASAVPSFCKYDKQVNMETFVNNPGGKWDGPGILPGSSMFDPSKALTNVPNTITYYTHSMPTATLCPDKKTVTIKVNDMPKVTIVTSREAGCSPVEVVLNYPNGNSGIGEWNFGDGSEPVKGLSTSHIFTNPGTYNITFSYQDEIGCRAKEVTLANPIKVYETPVADFSFPNEVLISSPEIQLTNLSTSLDDNKYYWKVEGIGELAHGQINAVISFPKVGRYPVTLTAESINHCKDEVTKVIEVKNDFNIFIPTSFSPNFDGLNDVFMPVFTEYGLDIKSYEMEIFDRWGHSLFRSKDIHKGWDGTNNKGEVMKQEIYLFKIKYKDMDGNTYNKMGHVSLLKG